MIKMGVCTKCAQSMQMNKISRYESSYWCPRCKLSAYQHLPRKMTVKELVAE